MYAFGSALEAELAEVEGQSKQEIHNKQQRILAQWLGLPQKFRNPVGPTDSSTGMVGPGNNIDKQFVMKGEPKL